MLREPSLPETCFRSLRPVGPSFKNPQDDWLGQVLIVACFLGITSKLGVGDRWKIAGLWLLFVFGPPYWPMISHHWLADACILASCWSLLAAHAGRPGRLAWAA